MIRKIIFRYTIIDKNMLTNLYYLMEKFIKRKISFLFVMSILIINLPNAYIFYR